jgi:hypothetical protein
VTQRKKQSHDQSKAITLHLGVEGGKFQKRGTTVSDGQGNIKLDRWKEWRFGRLSALGPLIN